MTKSNIGLAFAAGVLATALSATPVQAIDLDALAKKAGTKAAEKSADAARDKMAKKVNAKLMAEGRKNQCSFKTDSDELAPGCDKKLKNLVSALIDAKKTLDAGKVGSFKFEVSGHTDTSGAADHNKELSGKRAAVIVRELVSRGIDKSQIISIGMGSERPLVKPDDTPAKKAKNRRYEIQVRF
jgi:outer membrane protein OmpA-like peptidoglycan-associated protein